VTNVDWAPLRDENPVPGDPFATQDLARHFAERAATIDEVIHGLERLDTGDLESAAVDELRRLRDELIPDLRHLERRYERTAGALGPYCSALERAQEMALDALRRAQDAEADIGRARDGVEEMTRHAEEQVRIPVISAPGSPPPPPQPWPGPDWNAQLDDAEGRMTAAERLLQEAEDLYNEAGQNCANAINDAANDELQNEGGFFGDVGEFFEDAGDVIGGVADWVSDHWPSLEQWSEILGAVSAAVGLVALLFPPAELLAVGLGAVKLGIDIYLAAAGRQGWGDVVEGAIGLALFGVGRIAARASRIRAFGDTSSEVAWLNRTKGQAGALAGKSQLVPGRARPLTGAAYRNYRLQHAGRISRSFAADGQLGRLSRWRRWPQELLRLRAVDPVGVRQVLDYSRRAASYSVVAQVANRAGQVQAIWSAHKDLVQPLGGSVGPVTVPSPGSIRTS
jgi:hypothetical protein